MVTEATAVCGTWSSHAHVEWSQRQNSAAAQKAWEQLSLCTCASKGTYTAGIDIFFAVFLHRYGFHDVSRVWLYMNGTCKSSKHQSLRTEVSVISWQQLLPSLQYCILICNHLWQKFMQLIEIHLNASTKYIWILSIYTRNYQIYLCIMTVSPLQKQTPLS